MNLRRSIVSGLAFSAMLAMAAPVTGQPPNKPAAPAGNVKPPLPAAENSCILCHGDPDLWEGDRRKFLVAEKDLQHDIHWKKGLRCNDCHGGDPSGKSFAAAHNGDAKFYSVKSPEDIPGFCGRCHSDAEYMRRFQPSPRTDQLAEYLKSGHGKQLKEKHDFKVAVCTSCHGGRHHLSAVRDPDSPVFPTKIAETCATCHADAKLMAGRQFHGHPIGHDQVADWKKSVHAKALLEKGDMSAPTCNRCHGNHGALPPAVGTVSNVCGTCHGKISTLFTGTRMKHGFEQVGLPGCATCHGSHLIRSPNDEFLGMGENAVCAKCHANGKFGATLAGADVARTLRQKIDNLGDLIQDAKSKIAQAERLGMEVSGPRFDLRKATESLVNARTMIHTFSPGPVEESLSEGVKVATDVRDRADAALYEHTARRRWLGFSLVPIALVVGLLLVYIRRLPIPAAPPEGEGHSS
jgi:predicted CXXCH cytochrome family protein